MLGEERKQLSEEVADHVRHAIIAGELAPGASVKVDQLGRELNVSTTPVREALQILRTEGFLRLEPRRGFSVAPLTADDIRDIFRGRGLIAGELAARASVRVTPADLEILRRMQDDLVAAMRGRDHAKVERLAREFHDHIYDLAQSPRLRASAVELSRFAPRQFFSHVEGGGEMADSDHSAILDALSRGDAAASRDAMERHVDNSGEILAKEFERRVQSPQKPVDA